VVFHAEIDTGKSTIMFNSAIMKVLLVVALAVSQALAARVCTMENAEVDRRGRIKTYSGNIIEQFDEASTPAMQGNDCVELWCRSQCNQKSNCKNWAYLAIRGGKTTCTLYSKAKSKSVSCPGNVCASEYGKCKGSYDK
jgi:hypothetical protein